MLSKTQSISTSRWFGRESLQLPEMDLWGSWVATFQLRIYIQERRWFSSWILDLLSQESNPSFLILHGFTTDFFHSSHNFSLEIWAKVLTAVQPETQAMGHDTHPLLSSGASSPHPTFLCRAGLEWSPSTSLILALCFRASRWTCVKLLCNKVIWEGKNPKILKTISTILKEPQENPQLPQANIQSTSMGGLLEKERGKEYYHILLPVFSMHK